MRSDPRRRVHIHVQGLVQGVSFRAGARDEATRLGLVGWVRNNPDETVEVAAEGPPQAVDQFVEWCRRGPPAARVDEVDVTEEELVGERAFVMER
jgi:acylphosphatase